MGGWIDRGENGTFEPGWRCRLGIGRRGWLMGRGELGWMAGPRSTRTVMYVSVVGLGSNVAMYACVCMYERLNVYLCIYERMIGYSCM